MDYSHRITSHDAKQFSKDLKVRALDLAIAVTIHTHRMSLSTQPVDDNQLTITVLKRAKAFHDWFIDGR